jgi:hypothetical protein
MGLPDTCVGRNGEHRERAHGQRGAAVERNASGGAARKPAGTDPGGGAVKIRLWGTEDDCRQMAQLLINVPGFEVVSVSELKVDRGASVLVRVYVEARSRRSPARQSPPAAAATGRSRGEPTY